MQHSFGLLVHGYAGQTPAGPLPPIEASLRGQAEGFLVELLEAPGRGWR